MPQLDDFRTLINNITQTLETDLAGMRVVVDRLPELPVGVEYLQLGSFDARELAPLMLNMMTTTRETAVDALRLFTPMPLSYSERITPCFQPDAAVISLLRHSYGFGQIFPAVFYTQYTPGSIEGIKHQSQLIWYHQMPGYLTPRLAVVAHIKDDPSKLYPNDAVNMPAGLMRADPEIVDGMRTATVHWDAGLDMEKWYADFVHGTDQDGWTDLIQTEGEQ